MPEKSNNFDLINIDSHQVAHDSIDKFICYKNIILTYIMLKYKNAIEYFIGKESLVKIELENKDYVSIVIKKKLFFVDPTKFFELIVFLQNLFLLNAKKVISGINSFGEEKFFKMKNLYEKYLAFTPLKNNETEFQIELQEKKEKTD